MYIIEFERVQINHKEHVAVRLFDATAIRPQDKILAETTYMGQPPNLFLEAGCNFTALRLPRIESEVEQ